jgi:hypothetical protein
MGCMILRSSLSGLPVETITLEHLSALKMPSPVVLWSKNTKWPLCSPPRL